LSGYLKRVASRGLGAQAAPVVPLVRSRSPIAEEDQRVGMPGFVRPDLGNAESIEATLEDTGASAGLPSLMASPPLLTASGVVQRKAAGTAIGGKFGMSGSADAGAVIGASPARKPHADIAPSNLSPESTLRDSVVIDADQPTGLKQAQGLPGGIREIASDMRVDTELRRVEPLLPSRPNDVRAEEQAGQRRAVEGDSPLLEPSPRATILQTPQESISSGLLEPAEKREREPRVVIGRINVEVVPPLAEPKTSAVSRPGPLTAESVSVIGTLTRSVRSSRRLSLKYR
jgi:hypothetical protein